MVNSFKNLICVFLCIRIRRDPVWPQRPPATLCRTPIRIFVQRTISLRMCTIGRLCNCGVYRIKTLGICHKEFLMLSAPYAAMLSKIAQKRGTPACWSTFCPTPQKKFNLNYSIPQNQNKTRNQNKKRTNRKSDFFDTTYTNKDLPL